MASAVLTPMAPPADSAVLHWPHLQAQQTLLKAALNTALDEATSGVNFLLYGDPGTGKTEFVRHLIAEIGASAFVVADADEDGDEASRSERLASLQVSQTFAGHASHAVLVLDEAEDIFQTDYNHPLARLFSRGRESKAWMNALLEKNPHPVIWISNRVSQLDPAYLRRFTYCVEFPATPAAVRSRIARERLGAAGCSDGLVTSIAAVAEVTPAQLDAAARFAHLCRHADTGADAAVESQIRSHLKAGGRAELSLRHAPTTRFDMRYLNVAGNATPARVLQALAQGAAPGGPGVTATLLFSGPPGTGKTQLAGEIATQLGRRLIVRTASDINSKWYGGSEANVARMFRDCNPADEVLFLDEAEVLLSARESSNHRAEQAVTAEFLRWLEVFQGIFICASNHARSFDAALMRRFTFRIEFQPLSAVQRRAMYAELAMGWQVQSPDELPPVLDAAIEARLTRLDGLTPGDFANAARRIRSLALPSTAWIDELEAELGSKGTSATTKRIGFI
jgi:SpoVK/Ycf46/Vps4 family AAA+-type ATPase